MDTNQFLRNLNEYSSDLTIEGEIFDSTISVGGTVNSKKSIKDCEFKKEITFLGVAIPMELNFDSCTFDAVKLTALSGYGLYFNNCLFRGELTIKNNAITRLWFNGCIFEEKIKAKGSTSGDLMICKSPEKNSHLKENMEFYSCGFSSLIIRDTVSEKSISFDSSPISSIFLGDGNYESISFSNQKNLQNLTIQGMTESQENLVINNFHAPFLDLSGSILFQNAEICNMDLSRFNQNSGRFRMQNVKLRDKLVVREADLGRVVFNEADFSSAKISFDNSYIGDCVFSNVKWPLQKRMYSYKEILGEKISNKLKNTLILKEVYRQLKDVSKSQSSNVEALAFYRNEMVEYWNEIKEDRNFSKWEKFIVWVSKVSSDFGLSLKRPVCGLLFFHTVFCLLLSLFNYKGFGVNLLHINGENTVNSLGTYVSLLNPTHKFLEDENGLMQLIDFLIRLSSGFFIYHIIRATRKHSKL